jgi:hypothetical protein
MRRGRWIAVSVVIAAMLGFPAPSAAQISPGKLHRSHADLDGVKNCTKCHALGNQIPPEKCLDCHTVLRERIGAGRGLHARPEYRDCATCHIDHNGRDFELIFWKDGRDAFDHDDAGYALDGRHRGRRCDACHRAAFVADAAALRRHGVDPDRTFLGLGTACRTCHEDVHQGQLQSGCEACHSPAGWRPASGFDHDRARFTLTGRHRDVACAKCHPSDLAPTAAAASPVRYIGLRYASCSDCHRDVHGGRLAEPCASCHETSGWRDVKTASFNHDLTRYPLRGRHASVDCARCHRQGAAVRTLRYETCTDCHTDPHGGRFQSTPTGGACARCHTVGGFSPSTYTVAAHQECRYPLAGAHLAVPCVACHLESEVRETTGTVGVDTASSLPRFTFSFASTRCETCHADPHAGETKGGSEGDGCEACHRVESWRAIAYDHGRTRYALEGRHAAAPCTGCHRPVSPGAAPGRLAFRGLSEACAACHEDAHAGQLAGAPCERCHSPESWRAGKFDHTRDTRFAIDGAHARTPCAACHPVERIGDRDVARYRPTPSTCEACHAGGAPRPPDRKES